MFVLAKKNQISDYFLDGYSITTDFKIINNNSISVRTPGPFALFAQYNSYIYFSICMFGFSYILMFIENIINFFLIKYRFTFFIICFLLVWKFVHVGLGGLNTFFYYFSLLFFIFLIFIANYFLKKIYK
jgi:hypothetical protein